MKGENGPHGVPPELKNTKHSQEYIEKMAELYLVATMHPLDRYFMQARRLISLFERPISSATNMRRAYGMYSAYNPAMLQKMYDIFRVYYNYVKVETEPRVRSEKSPEEYINEIALSKGSTSRVVVPSKPKIKKKPKQYASG